MPHPINYHPHIHNVSSHRKTTCGQRESHIYTIYLHTGGPNVGKWKATHIQFISTLEGQMWAKGKPHIYNLSPNWWAKCGQRESHTYTIYLHTGGPNVGKGKATHMQFISKLVGQMWAKGKPHIYNLSPHCRAKCGQRESHI